MKKNKTAEKEAQSPEMEEKATLTAEENEATAEEVQEIENEELSELDKTKAELAEAKDKYLRLYSEFENYRRRTSKEKLDMIQTANEGLMSELLPIIDDFERAEKSAEDQTDIKAVQEGVTLIAHKFNKSLANKGLKAMESDQGTDFDPELHEAITQVPAPSEELKGKVVDTIEKGYFLGDKVIRFAKVVIGN